MTTYSCSVSVPYSPEQMRILVADVRSYPAFIKWIQTLVVRSESTSETRWSGRAVATIGFKGLTESFTTDVVSDSETNVISVRLVRGPFKRLKNEWRFQERCDGCDIKFHIDFEFSNIILRMLLKANFDRAVRVLMATFIEEAHRRYRDQSVLVD